MTTQLHDGGEEFLIKQIFHSDVYSLPASLTVGVFHDGEVSGDTGAGDDLSDSATMSDITTGTGVTNTITLDSTGWNVNTHNSTTWFGGNANTQTFDLSGVSSGTIDAWYIQATWDPNDDATDTDELICTGNLSQSYDLSNVDTLDIDPNGIGFDVD